MPASSEMKAILSFGNPGSSGTYAALAFMTASIAT